MSVKSPLFSKEAAAILGEKKKKGGAGGSLLRYNGNDYVLHDSFLCYFVKVLHYNDKITMQENTTITL